MKVILSKDMTVDIGGVAVAFVCGDSLDIVEAHDRESLASLCDAARIPADLSYTEGGVRYVQGAGGKFVAVPEEPKVEKPKVEKPKEPKAEKKAKK